MSELNLSVGSQSARGLLSYRGRLARVYYWPGKDWQVVSGQDGSSQ